MVAASSTSTVNGAGDSKYFSSAPTTSSRVFSPAFSSDSTPSTIITCRFASIGIVCARCNTSSQPQHRLPAALLHGYPRERPSARRLRHASLYDLVAEHLAKIRIAAVQNDGGGGLSLVQALGYLFR